MSAGLRANVSLISSHDDVPVELEQRSQHADVRHVLHENARARVREPLVAHPRERHANDLDIGTRQQPIARPRRVVEQDAAGRHLLQVARVGLRVHRNHDVDRARAREVAILADSDLVPGRQPLDVRRKEVLAADRDSHAEYRLHQQRVGTRGTGAVDVRNLEDEVVYPAFLLSCHSASPSRASSRA